MATSSTERGTVPTSDYNMCATGFLNDVRQHCDPWQHLSIPDLFPGITLRFTAKLPFGVWALTDFEKRSILLAMGMNAAELRCTLAHEIVHLERGMLTEETEHADEMLCDIVAVSRLVPVRDLIGLGDRVEREGVKEVADALTIDEKTLEVAVELENFLLAIMNKGIGSADGDANWRHDHVALDLAARS